MPTKTERASDGMQMMGHTAERVTPPAFGLSGVLAVCNESLAKASDFFRATRRCPRTTTLVGKSPTGGYYHFIPVRCKCWTCPHCCKINARNLEDKLAQGKPSTFITLTCRPSADETPKEAHDRCRPKIARMFAQLRAEFGTIEFACILETHKNGFPHWHILARAPYLPHGRIKELWQRMTGNSIVAIEKIRHHRSMGKYLVKYCGKEMQVPSFNRLGRVVSFSRNFLSPLRVTPQTVKLEWVKWTEPIESVIPRYQFMVDAMEVFPSGEVIAYVDKGTRPEPHELAFLKWLNEYHPPKE